MKIIHVIGMARHLPPLTALRSFEAAARLLSFKKAAESLNVSPSAVSHAVQNLEDYLGVKLFHRLASGKRQDKALILSDAGQALLPSLIRSFDDMEEATNAIMAQGVSDILSVATAPIFARSWLMPRLHRFVSQYPDVNIRVNSTLNPSDSLYADFDVGLLYGQGNWPGQEAELIIPETMVPVCSPALLHHGRKLESPKDLVHHTLIHSEARLVSWSMWLENAGLRLNTSTKGLHFNRAALAIDAAINGLGVALEGKTAVAHELESGQLIIPFEAPSLPDRRDGYYLTCSPKKRQLPKVAQFYSWVLSEIEMNL